MTHILDNLDFEKHIAELSDRKLLEFTAREVFESNHRITGLEKRTQRLESRDRKMFGMIGGIGSLIGTAIGAAIAAFMHK